MKSFIALLLPSLGAASFACLPDGPILPKLPLCTLSSSPVLAEAAANLTANLDDAVAGVINAGWETANASFSLALISTGQADPGVPLWEYHHLAEANTEGTAELNRNSQYLIGSISKAISSYILLVADVNIDAPVTEFLPELAEPGSLIHWEDVSLRMLAAHLSGAPANYGFSEYYFLKEVFLAYGLPPIDDSEYPPCGVTGLNGGCSQEDFIQGMRNSYPITAPNERPAYSNIAFTLIFMAIENVTGKNYTVLVDELFAQPLGLSNTRPSPGDDDQAVIPPGDNSWGADYSFNAPGGGLVSSLSDLSKFVHAIISHDLPSLTPSQTRGWLKPSSFAEGADTIVGMPWEIFRSTALTPAHPHPVTLYTKGGGALSYRSHMYISEQYGVGFVMLTAGPMDALTVISDAVLAALVPAIDEAVREDAEAQYARTFVSRGGNATEVSASFELDDDSLVLSSLQRGDADLLAGLVDILGFTVGQYVVPVALPLRLFPLDLDERVNLADGTPVIQEVWRISPTLDYSSNGSELPGAGVFGEASICLAWTIGDWAHYGGEPLDRLVFYRSEDGDVVGFEAPFLRSGILRPE